MAVLILGPAEPGESNVSTEVPDLEEFEQVPEEDLVIRPLSDQLVPPVATMAEAVTMRVKDASSVKARERKQRLEQRRSSKMLYDLVGLSLGQPRLAISNIIYICILYNL